MRKIKLYKIKKKLKVKHAQRLNNKKKIKKYLIRKDIKIK